MATVRPANSELRESIKKEVAQQAAKWLVAFAVAAVTFAVTGWWLYLKPKIGGVPASMVSAFDLPEGCPWGWESAKGLGGKTIIGVGKGHGSDGHELSDRRYREEGGTEKHTLSTDEMPAHSHSGETIGKWNGQRPAHILGTGVPNESGKIGETGGSKAHNNMPPFVVLFYCKKI